MSIKIRNEPDAFSQIADQVVTLEEMPKGGFNKKDVVVVKGIIYISKNDNNKKHTDDSTSWIRVGTLRDIIWKIYVG